MRSEPGIARLAGAAGIRPPWALALAAALWGSFAPGAPATRAAAASDATVPGALTVATTTVSASFEWRIEGDADGDCAVTLEYRRAGESAWRAARPLLRVETGLWTHGEDPGNLLAGSLFFLQPATAWEARLTLADPDGGAEQRVVACTTRAVPRAVALRTLYVVPGSGGGAGTISDPLRGLAAANAVALPGDLFLVQAGTYAGTFRVTRDGTAASPITYRGVSAASVILDQGGGTSSTSRCIDLTGRHDVMVENMSLVNGLRPLVADSSTRITVRGCTVRPVTQLLSTHGIRAAVSTDLYIEDNTVQMPGQWATIGRTGSYGTGGYGILVEGTGHVIARNTIVEAWDAISIPVTGTAVPACITSNVDIWGNLVDRASDDGVQADAVRHNVRVWRNRLLNTGSAVSFQPCFGGPGYVLFNEVFNNRIEPWKFHPETSYGWTQETSGFVVEHNTSVCSRNAWYESGSWRHGTFRDNLFVGTRPSVNSLYMPYAPVVASFDADGWNRVGGYTYLVRFGGASYTTLPAFAAATGNESHGREVTAADFVNLVWPHDPLWNSTDGYGAAYAEGDYDLRLPATSTAVDAGLALPGIDDAALGAAPDLGCLERGGVTRDYGARAANAPPVVALSGDTLVGKAPLTVRFAAVADDADGIVAALRWDFGDGTSAWDVRAPSHTYATPGRRTVSVVATDDEGAESAATVEVNATVYSAADGSAAPVFALAPPRPAPAAGPVIVAFTLPRATVARVDVHDLRGARVRVLFAGPAAAGAHELAWNGCDDRRRALPPGVYFVRLVADGRDATRRIVLLR